MRRIVVPLAAIGLISGLGVVSSALAVGGSWGASSDPQSTILLEPTDSSTARFQDFDLNHDGYISKKEAERGENATLTQEFDHVDVDADNRLDQAEFSQFEVIEGQMPSSSETQRGTRPKDSDKIIRERERHQPDMMRRAPDEVDQP